MVLSSITLPRPWAHPPAGVMHKRDRALRAVACARRADKTHRRERDRLTPAQKAVSGFTPGYFDDIGWGLGMSVRTRRAPGLPILIDFWTAAYQAIDD